MSSDFSTSTDVTSVNVQLFEKMKRERGERGQYAVEMLETADRLLGQTEQLPRQAEAAAYCIRQAVVEIFGDEDMKTLSEVIGLVKKARHRVKPKSLQDKNLIQDVLDAIDELEHFETRSKHKARLTRIFQRECKIDIAPGDYSLPDVYQCLIDDLNKLFVHGVSAERGDHYKVRRLYTKAIDILTTVFLPVIWLHNISNLAQLREPDWRDAWRLKEIIVNARGFDHFACKMVSSDWFDLLDPDMLKSASDGQPWLLRYLAIRLKDEHTDKFICFVEKNFNRWAKEDIGLAELGFVGERLGDAGLPLLAKALRKSESVRQQCNRVLADRSEAKQSDPRRNKVLKVLNSIEKLEHSAFDAYQAAKPSNPEIIELADRLLDFCVSIHKDFQTTIIPTKLVESMDSVSAARIIDILTYKIRAWLRLNEIFYIPEFASIADIDPNSGIGLNPMVGSLRSALTKARDLGLSTSQLIGTLYSIQDNAGAPRQYVHLDYIKHRLIAWLYSSADDVGRTEVVDFVVKSCGSRLPTGDDELLLARLERNGHLDRDTVERIHNRIHEAPDAKKMSGRPRQWNLNKEEVWRILWAHILHRRIEMPSGWEPCIETLNPLIDRDRRIADEWKSADSQTQESPIGPEISNDADPHAVATKIAAWDIRTLNLLGYVGVYDLVQKLTSAIAHNTAKWVEDPIEIITALHYPTYVAGYLGGLAGSVEELHTHTDRLISAVRFVRTHPWSVTILDSAPFGFDVSWESVDIAGTNLIKTMVEKNVPLDDVMLCEVWDLLCEAVSNRSTESSEYAAESLIDAIDRKPYTCALTAMMHLIVYAVNRKKDIPKKALAVLTESVRLTGRTGKEYRTVLGMWLEPLRMAIPDWFKQHESLLLENEISKELGQTTLDAHIQWVRPDPFILKKYRNGVLDAAKRNMLYAMDHLLLCMLHDVSGYKPKWVAESLANTGSEHILRAERLSVQLLNREDVVNVDHIRRGMEFWEGVLDLKPEPEALVGFGQWATVAGISQSQWERMTLSTCDLMVKKPDSAKKVAERISSAEEVTETGLKILVLLMRMDLDYETYPVAEHAADALRKIQGRAWYARSMDTTPRHIGAARP